jgi:hypothetical protein
MVPMILDMGGSRAAGRRQGGGSLAAAGRLPRQQKGTDQGFRGRGEPIAGQRAEVRKTKTKKTEREDEGEEEGEYSHITEHRYQHADTCSSPTPRPMQPFLNQWSLGKTCRSQMMSLSISIIYLYGHHHNNNTKKQIRKQRPRGRDSVCTQARLSRRFPTLCPSMIMTLFICPG